jgi:hypothetical protein
MGREVLERTFGDERLFEICQAIAAEEKKALERLKELSALVHKDNT